MRATYTNGVCTVREEAVEFLVVANGELQVTRDDTRLLVVAGGVASELEDLGGEVLEDSSDVDCVRADGVMRSRV